MNHGGQSGSESDESSIPSWQGPAESGPSNVSATTRITGENSRRTTTSFPDSTLQSASSPEDGHVQIIQKLKKEIESFRNNEITKMVALASIIRILEVNIDVQVTQSQKESTFDSYLTEILVIESSRDNDQDVNRTVNDTTLQPIDQSTIKPRVKQRARDFKESTGSDSEPDDDERKPSKKSKLLESDMPWYEPSPDFSSQHSNPSCEKICRLLRAYNQDTSKAKFFVKIAPKSPSGIPSSQWERILKGEPVDLNQIFSSLHHVVIDEERTGRLGETEISFGVAGPKRRISTAAEWSTAWRKASKAITFAFPHRREELLEYGDYIESEFAAKITSSHHKILLYDTALRNEVAAGQHVLLTDHARFTRLYSAIVMPDGIEGASDELNTRKPTKPKGEKPEICNKFNAGKCKKHDAECKYRLAYVGQCCAWHERVPHQAF